jgi:DNA replication protein DnaC
MENNIHPEAMAFLEGITPGTNKKKILLITGKVGRGKTFLMRQMFQWAEKEAKPCLWPRWAYVSRAGEEMESLIYLFTAETFMDERGDTARRQIKVLAETRLLFIDDMGSERNPPPTFESGLSSLIEQRVDAGGSTVISTNLGEDAIQARYGDRNLSRLVGFSEIIELSGPDRRRS